MIGRESEVWGSCPPSLWDQDGQRELSNIHGSNHQLLLLSKTLVESRHRHRAKMLTLAVTSCKNGDETVGTVGPLGPFSHLAAHVYFQVTSHAKPIPIPPLAISQDHPAACLLRLPLDSTPLMPPCSPIPSPSPPSQPSRQAPSRPSS